VVPAWCPGSPASLVDGWFGFGMAAPDQATYAAVDVHYPPEGGARAPNGNEPRCEAASQRRYAMELAQVSILGGSRQLWKRGCGVRNRGDRGQLANARTVGTAGLVQRRVHRVRRRVRLAAGYRWADPAGVATGISAAEDPRSSGSRYLLEPPTRAFGVMRFVQDDPRIRRIKPTVGDQTQPDQLLHQRRDSDRQALRRRCWRTSGGSSTGA